MAAEVCNAGRDGYRQLAGVLMPNFHLRGLDGWGTGRPNIVDHINDNNIKTYQEIEGATHQEIDMDAVESFLLLVTKLYKYGVDGVGTNMPKRQNRQRQSRRLRQPTTDNQSTAHRKLPN